MRASTTTLLLIVVSGTAHAAFQVPLCPGLTIVTAINQQGGDYESIKTVETVTPSELRIKYSSEAPDRDMLSSNAGQLKSTTVYRRMLIDDLRSSNLYQQVFATGSDELIPGTTAIGTSRIVLDALRTRGEATLSVSEASLGEHIRADRKLRPNVYDFFTSGRLERVGTVKMPVLVNDRLVEVSAIHARGDYFGDKNEFFFLDDESNPLTLKFRLGIGAIKPMLPDMAETCAALRKAGPAAITGWENQCLPEGGDRDVLQVVKITYRCPAGALNLATGGAGAAGSGNGPGGAMNAGGSGGSGGVAALEQALKDNGKADIYSIYFSYNSDAIRKESEQTLAEIGALMRKHPDWKLGIYGHTDNIASDKYNLDLSRRRAAAVVKALTARHGVDAGRLTFGGQGESAPKVTNDTLEGRAKNRRVELVRMS